MNIHSIALPVKAKNYSYFTACDIIKHYKKDTASRSKWQLPCMMFAHTRICLNTHTHIHTHTHIWYQITITWPDNWESTIPFSNHNPRLSRAHRPKVTVLSGTFSFSYWLYRLSYWCSYWLFWDYIADLFATQKTL